MKLKLQNNVQKTNSQPASISRNTTQKAGSRKNFHGIKKREAQNGSNGIGVTVRMHARVVNKELTLKEAKKSMAEQGIISEESCVVYFCRLNKKTDRNRLASELAKEVINETMTMENAVKELVDKAKTQETAAINKIRFFISAEKTEIHKTGSVKFMLNSC